jgi:hypothetical protein
MVLTSAFKTEIPILHPKSYDYKTYWKEQIGYSIAGKWVAGTWMSPRLYFYQNFFNILQNLDGSHQKVTAPPKIRDVEWEVFSHYEECKGFSGFDEDEYFTCFRDIENIDSLGVIELAILKERAKHAWNEQFQEWKKYIPAREYLRKTHVKNLGVPLYYNSAKNFLLMSGRGIGKALPDDTIIPMADGAMKAIKHIMPGDYVISPNGLPVKVIATNKFKNQPVWDFHLSDGRKVSSADNHVWELWEKKKELSPSLKTTDEIIEYITTTDPVKLNKHKMYIRLTEPIEYDYKELPIDPYWLGLWLGDGTSANTTITTMDHEIADYCRKYGKKHNLITWITANPGRSYNVRFVSKDKENYRPNTISKKLAEMSLKGNKHIPEEYLISSIKQRRSLLQGLMDTDGGISTKGRTVTYTTTSVELRDGVKRLLQSLGIKHRINQRLGYYTIPGTKERKYTKEVYIFSIWTNQPIFRLTRKKLLHEAKTRTLTNFDMKFSYIKSISAQPAQSAICIQVDHPSGMFLTENYVPTHNSYIISSITLHEWLFDGIPPINRFMSDDLKLKYLNKETKTSVILGAGDSQKTTETMNKVMEGLNKLPGSYMIGEKNYPSPLNRKFKGNPKTEIVASSKKKVGGEWMDTPTPSRIRNVSFMDNSSAAQGDRNNLIVFEEAGHFRNIRESYGDLTNNMRTDVDGKFGVLFACGTGGNAHSTDIEYIFYHPELFDMLTFNDEWEQRGKICYFIPSWYGFNTLRDPNGYIYEKEAKKRLDDFLEKKRKNSDKSTYEKELAYQARTPSEVFLRPDGNIFPVYELRQRLTELEKSGIRDLLAKRISLHYQPDTPNGVGFELLGENGDAIDNYPWPDGNSTEGCVVMYETPIEQDVDITTNSGKTLTIRQVPSDMYVIGHDPYRTDAEKGSLASIVVMKNKKYAHKFGHDEIVAVYYGRPFGGRDKVNEILYKLALFYNAKIMFENNVGNVKDFFEKKKRLDLLYRKPGIMSNRDETGKPNIEYGYPLSNQKIKMEALQYLNTWLLEERGVERTRIQQVTYGKYGKKKIIEFYQENKTEEFDEYKKIRNLDKITDRRIIQELISYSLDGNFDAVHGLIGCILQLEDDSKKTEIKLLSNNSINMDFISNNSKIFNRSSSLMKAKQ